MDDRWKQNCQCLVQLKMFQNGHKERFGPNSLKRSRVVSSLQWCFITSYAIYFKILLDCFEVALCPYSCLQIWIVFNGKQLYCSEHHPLLRFYHYFSGHFNNICIGLNGDLLITSSVKAK